MGIEHLNLEELLELNSKIKAKILKDYPDTLVKDRLRKVIEHVFSKEEAYDDDVFRFYYEILDHMLPLFQNNTITPLPECNRVEVIGGERLLVKKALREVKVSLQDDAKTFKVFLK